MRQLPASIFTNYFSRNPTGEIYPTNATDRLGLGLVPAPGVRAHIGSGALRIEDFIGTTTRMVTVLPNGNLATTSLAPFENYWTRNPSAGHVTLVTGTDFIGIGTATPLAQLHTTGKVRFSDLAVAGGNRQVMADANGELYTVAPTQELWTRNSAALTTYLVNGGDRLGIGTATPLQKVHIAGLNNTIRIEQMPVGTGSDQIVVRDGNGDLKQVDPSTFNSPWARNPANNEIYQKNLADYVGIGTNSPNSQLHIQRAGGTGYVNPVELRIQNTTNGGSAQIRLRDRASTNTNADNYNSMLVRYVGSTNNFQIANGSDSTFFNMRRQNGYIFLGSRFPTQQPTERLHVDGNIRLEDGFRIQFSEQNSYLSDNGGVAGDDDLILRAHDILYLRGGNNTGLNIRGNGEIDTDNIPTNGSTTNSRLLVLNGSGSTSGIIRSIDLNTISSPLERQRQHHPSEQSGSGRGHRCQYRFRKTARQRHRSSAEPTRRHC